MDTIDGEFDLSSSMAPLYEFNEEESALELIGSISLSKDFKQFFLKLDDGTYYAAPATDLEDAKQILDNQ